MIKLFEGLSDTASVVKVNAPNTLYVQWSLKGYGFGTFTFVVKEDGVLWVDDECSSRETVKKVLGILIDNATFDSDSKERPE